MIWGSYLFCGWILEAPVLTFCTLTLRWHIREQGGTSINQSNHNMNKILQHNLVSLTVTWTFISNGGGLTPKTSPRIIQRYLCLLLCFDLDNPGRWNDILCLLVACKKKSLNVFQNKNKLSVMKTTRTIYTFEHKCRSTNQLYECEALHKTMIVFKPAITATNKYKWKRCKQSTATRHTFFFF